MLNQNDVNFIKDAMLFRVNGILQTIVDMNNKEIVDEKPETKETKKKGETK